MASDEEVLEVNGIIERVYAHGLIDFEITGTKICMGVTKGDDGSPYVRIDLEFPNIDDMIKALLRLKERAEKLGLN